MDLSDPMISETKILKKNFVKIKDPITLRACENVFLL